MSYSWMDPEKTKNNPELEKILKTFKSHQV